MKTDDQLHHPVTNGKTKLMILLSLIFLALIAALGMIFAFIGTYNLTGISLWGLKGGMLGISTTSVGGIVYAVHSFFDTRESSQKQTDKLAREKARYDYKIEKMKIKKNK